MCIPVGRRSRHLPLSLLSVLCARCERGLWIVIYSTRHFANCIPTCADRFRCGLVVSQSCLHHQTQEEKKNSFFFFFLCAPWPTHSKRGRPYPLRVSFLQKAAKRGLRSSLPSETRRQICILFVKFNCNHNRLTRRRLPCFQHCLTNSKI